MKLIDSHCHLNYDYAPKTTADLIREARDAGIEHMITIGTDLESIAAVQKISEENDCVSHTVGVHPHDASKLEPGLLETLRQAARHPKCRAIGEIGLDYYYEHSDKKAQAWALEAQLELALELDLPVVIHSRDAEEDLGRALEGYAKKVSSEKPVGIIHCFSGTREFGERCLGLGFLLSLSGIITFKNAEALRDAVKSFPIDRLLIETDSPYLAPIPYRGKKCEPAMVKLTAQKLAEIKGVTLDEVARVTTANARKFFRI